MTRTPRRNGSQPDPATVINLDERRNTQALGGNRRPQRSSSGTEETADCRNPMPGSDEWWENALAAFKEYLEPGAAGREHPARSNTDGNEARSTNLARRPRPTSGAGDDPPCEDRWQPRAMRARARSFAKGEPVDREQRSAGISSRRRGGAVLGGTRADRPITEGARSPTWGPTGAHDRGRAAQLVS